jgi:hypothetical protein
MVEIAVRPSGPYSLALSARLAGDATRRVRDGLFTARCCGAVARAWQSPDGTVTLRDRDTLEQERIPLEGARELLEARLEQPWRPQ